MLNSSATTDTKLQELAAVNKTSRKSQLPLAAGKQEVKAPEGIMGQEVEQCPVDKVKSAESDEAVRKTCSWVRTWAWAWARTSTWTRTTVTNTHTTAEAAMTFPSCFALLTLCDHTQPQPVGGTIHSSRPTSRKQKLQNIKIMTKTQGLQAARGR